jgi:hypothetical protein
MLGIRKKVVRLERLWQYLKIPREPNLAGLSTALHTGAAAIHIVRDGPVRFPFSGLLRGEPKPGAVERHDCDSYIAARIVRIFPEANSPSG